MIPAIPSLEDYGISPDYGFLPDELPLELLPDPYYNRWEAVVANLQALILSRRLREVIHRLPILSTSNLLHPAEWRRAYMLLAFMTHGYIWGGDKPEEVCSEQIRFRKQLTPATESPTTHCHTFPTNLRTSRASPRCNICRSMPVELQAYISR